ncbi:Rrf2 family transcriptional regulator [Janibacter sp. RAF52]|uniref:RrF2 family transcriptional regulator n=1 Tax=Janibacter TaxID=53457 RepID=UPI0027B89BA3|nr:Rrf2 family transcriptional regulator [Janibacter hoylei]
MSQVVVTTPGPARDTEGMDISARSDYAVRAMLTLAAATDGGTPVSVVRLAAEQELPRKFLEAILADLRRAELVVSRMGASGGYLLARPATQISVGAVIRAVDGPLAEVRGERPQAMTYDGAATHLRTVWVAVRSSVRSVLDGTSLADVLSGDFPAAVEEALAAPDAWENR